MQHLSKHLPGPNITLINFRNEKQRCVIYPSIFRGQILPLLISEVKSKDATFIQASSGAKYYTYSFLRVKTKMRHLSKHLPGPNITFIHFRGEKQRCDIYLSIFRSQILYLFISEGKSKDSIFIQITTSSLKHII